jgi:hypothetical protein
VQQNAQAPNDVCRQTRDIRVFGQCSFLYRLPYIRNQSLTRVQRVSRVFFIVPGILHVSNSYKSVQVCSIHAFQSHCTSAVAYPQCILLTNYYNTFSSLCAPSKSTRPRSSRKCKLDPGKQITNFHRCVIRAQISPVSPESGGDNRVYVFDLVGSAFLYHQVRHIMAVLFLVGTGVEQPSTISALMNVSHAESNSLP